MKNQTVYHLLLTLHRSLLAACGLGLLLLGTNPVEATTRAVSNLNDSGPGSLRATIAASTNPGDVIVFMVSLRGRSTVLAYCVLNRTPLTEPVTKCQSCQSCQSCHNAS